MTYFLPASPVLSKPPVDVEGADARPRRAAPALRSPTLILGVVVLVFWVFCAILGTHVVPFDPYADNVLSTFTPPDSEHWFGTDQLGRDVFSRVIVGSRDILTVAPLATVLGVGWGPCSACYLAMSAAGSTQR